MDNPANMKRSKFSSQPRRTWNTMEEQILIEALKDLVVRGFKSDNGFRTGYLNLLERSMADRFPGTDLKAEPHISSKIHAWKKSYNALSSMLAKSGFGLLPNFMIDVSDEVWAVHVKVEPSVRTMRFKTWPYYKDWVEIFGKDRATGDHAQGFADAMQEFLNPINLSPRIPSIDENATDDCSPEHNAPEFAECSNTSKRSGKSKNRRPSASSVENDEEQLGVIAKRICDLLEKKNIPDDPSFTKRSKVYEILKEIEFTNLEARVHVGRYLCNNESDLDYFLSLPDEARMVLVKDILDKI